MDEAEDKKKWPIFIGVQLCGITVIALAAIWGDAYLGGIKWTKTLIFNYHPLFMVIGFIVLYGNGMIIYRTFINFERTYVKLAHATLNFLSFIFAIIGVTSVFLFHSWNDIPHMYSIHSWIGLVTFLIFGCQWIMSLLVFLYPGARHNIRVRMMPIHKHIGKLLFVGIVIACITGITEKNIFRGKYALLQSAEMLSNFLGVMIVVFGGLIYLGIRS